MATPVMKRKNGNTRSAGVQPCHLACRRGSYTHDQLPGVLTRIISATVKPRKTSSACKRSALIIAHPFPVSAQVVQTHNHTSVVRFCSRAPHRSDQTPEAIIDCCSSRVNIRKAASACQWKSGRRNAAHQNHGHRFLTSFFV